MAKNLTLIDKAIVGFDSSLRAIIPHSNPSTRPLPVSSETIPQLSINESRHVAGLMRINHTGEVCAQGLYHGQAFTAKNAHVKDAMQHSADEEIDHLVWCETRLDELGSHPSVFTPVWYGLSFGLGAVAGLISDEFSLGFVAETEAQVSEHLEDHMGKLPEQDTRSKEILAQMNIEELEHRQAALDYGGQVLPAPVKSTMRWMANQMKAVAYHL
ncbi:2-polyprenyl-3-methyl-6-methoxy-1,4-benzoquinone monooxygenase [Psychrobacter sp. FDAARGOS_221]|uniref:2-polyprenyl-3-methyl-6-methoxy-1,4-benzoquinone monooxygenase n=1 Tax=Psychrobacter sp. FDAARGOS_221 TaxID=1975705 RepID=UPI000BB53A5F|nr:2-polyprenyl-3-methyl-6-methoxy-1,4-benzoquinone monooxygenase [Psychrobacter sp. FDAARGOS_221]PNK61687.1 demethoxyubiquinone hydroxylase family protein [Psychrobacter sp. FDAARGOS_221]